MTLSWLWSPEQINGIGKLIGLPVSHEWIYRHIAADKACGGKFYRCLRQGHKRYRKGRKSKLSAIPDPLSVDERPAIEDVCTRFGDWEIVTVLGKHGTGALVTLAERNSRLYLARVGATPNQLQTLMMRLSLCSSQAKAIKIEQS